MAVPIEISRYSFRVFSCACPSVISSISGKSFHFPFLCKLINREEKEQHVLDKDLETTAEPELLASKLFYSANESHYAG